MIPQTYKDLIEKLIKGTELKKISWGITSRDTEYKVVLGSSMVTTDNWTNSGGVKCIDIAIWNSNGDKISSIVRRLIDSEQDEYNEILRLYTLARDSYLKVDETIEEIMSQLDF